MISSLRATKAAILDAALRHVPTHGWHESLNMGCREAGLSPAAKSCLFPRQHAPVFSLIQYFQLLADNHMIQHVSQATTSKSESPSAKAVEAVPFSKCVFRPPFPITPRVLVGTLVPSSLEELDLTRPSFVPFCPCNCC